MLQEGENFNFPKHVAKAATHVLLNYYANTQSHLMSEVNNGLGGVGTWLFNNNLLNIKQHLMSEIFILIYRIKSLRQSDIYTVFTTPLSEKRFLAFYSKA